MVSTPFILVNKPLHHETWEAPRPDGVFDCMTGRTAAVCRPTGCIALALTALPLAVSSAVITRSLCTEVWHMSTVWVWFVSIVVLDIGHRHVCCKRHLHALHQVPLHSTLKMHTWCQVYCFVPHFNTPMTTHRCRSIP
jgi:hypothetical protein